MSLLGTTVDAKTKATFTKLCKAKGLNASIVLRKLVSKWIESEQKKIKAKKASS